MHVDLLVPAGSGPQCMRNSLSVSTLVFFGRCACVRTYVGLKSLETAGNSVELILHLQQRTSDLLHGRRTAGPGLHAGVDVRGIMWAAKRSECPTNESSIHLGTHTYLGLRTHFCALIASAYACACLILKT
jgi:hypothetical protein